MLKAFAEKYVNAAALKNQILGGKGGALRRLLDNWAYFELAAPTAAAAGASGPDSDEDYELIEMLDFELDDSDDCAESDEGGGWDSESDSDD